jgi:hypothetical protein
MNELELKRRVSSNRVLAFAVMSTLGVLLSYLHDIAQLAMFSVGEWAFYRFIAQDGPWPAIILVNFVYQAMSRPLVWLVTIIRGASNSARQFVIWVIGSM